MKRSWWYRFSFLLLAVIICVLSIMPTAFDFKEEDNFPVKSKINLGLDLQGGLYMILGIDFRKVFKEEVKGYARRGNFSLKDEKTFGFELGDINTEDALDPKMKIDRMQVG